MKKLFGFFFILIGILILLFTIGKPVVGGLLFEERNVHASAAADGVKTIKVEASAANIHIVPYERTDVQAQYLGNGRLSVDRDGDRVTIHLKKSWLHWLSDWLSSAHRTLNVYMPKDYDQGVEVHLSAGNISFEGSSVDQPVTLDQLELDLSAGEIYLKNLQIHDLKSDLSAGNTYISHISTTKAILKASAGNVTLKHYKGTFRADLSAGNLSAQIDQLQGPIEANNSLGNLSLDLPAGANISLHADASVGHVVNDFSENKTSDASASDPFSVELSTSAGNIHIY